MSILETFEKYGVTPHWDGPDRYSCICPFHEEKLPSCKIYLSTDSWFCFGCSRGGDVVDFIALKENMNRYAVIDMLETGDEKVKAIQQRLTKLLTNEKSSKPRITYLEAYLLLNRYTKNFLKWGRNGGFNAVCDIYGRLYQQPRDGDLRDFLVTEVNKLDIGLGEQLEKILRLAEDE